ncbi:DMT family transporter [Flavobacterium subsaxonicum]|uniref:Transporter n=1 Tax=Flavobacterium subsaxonicum WB 4.1-42 = DSM 21790 TaxID=1121898 RepID=A0A0A2MQC9_9FLAO|nr:DMT family transporter [Flavobacterium subsaxonicum]KGO93766.1 transporter [Flavobacterium subsaxonicum WB 4.1-42 = DSM 21790]
MLYLVLSIICSVSVGIIFKTIRNHDTCITQIVLFNYVFAIILCYLFFSPDINVVTSTAPWGIYIPLMLLLPTIFLFLASSVRHVGIVRTDAAQRLSLFIPILAAWFIFKEQFNTLKLAGLAVGFPALMLILSKKKDKAGNNWLYPAIVLVGFGVIDVLFKQIALYKALPYTTSLFLVFCGALAVMVVFVLYEVIFLRIKLNIINLAFGALVGIFNFGNILFYMKAHKAFADNPSTVFAAMNMGVIVLGSIAGILIFKEKVSKINYLGLILALGAIVLIALSQLYK